MALNAPNAGQSGRLVECPYRECLTVLDLARAHGARVDWSDEKQAARIVGADEQTRARLTGLLGVVDVDDPRWLAMLEDLERVAPGLVRVTRNGDTARAVYLTLPTRLALVRLLRSPDRATMEAITVPVATLRELPGWTIDTVRPLGTGRLRCVFTTSRGTFDQATKAGAAAFSARELEAMGLAAELDRAYPHDLAEWVARKRANPTFAVGKGAAGALDVRGVTEATRPTWSLGRVLDALGLDLVRVAMAAQGGV